MRKLAFTPIGGTSEMMALSDSFGDMVVRIQELMTRVRSEEVALRKTELRALQAQINPHFMFNILAMISMKAGLCGNTEIQKLLSAFSKLLQGKIFRSGEILIPLSEELELVEFYLYLQSNRFSGKINYEIQCGDGLEQDRPSHTFTCRMSTVLSMPSMGDSSNSRVRVRPSERGGGSEEVPRPAPALVACLLSTLRPEVLPRSRVGGAGGQ